MIIRRITGNHWESLGITVTAALGAVLTGVVHRWPRRDAADHRPVSTPPVQPNIAVARARHSLPRRGQRVLGAQQGLRAVPRDPALAGAHLSDEAPTAL